MPLKFRKLFYIISSIILTHTQFSFTSDLEKNTIKNNYLNNPINKKYEAPKYTLGIGDKISIRVFKTESFNSQVSILPDGSINLPRIGSINVWGLTINEAKEKITKKYKDILRNPIIYIDLISARDVRVLVSGEVQRPGIYAIGEDSVNTLSNTDGGEINKISSKGWPTVVEALQKAGGVSSKGDIRNIELRRGNDPQKIIVLNFWDSLKNGEPAYNPYIYDEDSIRVLEVKSRPESESLAIAGSSFSPSSITVNVIGEVENPGTKKIRANSPLNTAIFSAGGLNEYSDKNNIKMIRLKNDGSVQKKSYEFSKLTNINDATNPALRDGDIIVVPKNKLASFTSSLKFVIEPVGPIINAASLYKILNQ